MHMSTQTHAYTHRHLSSFHTEWKAGCFFPHLYSFPKSRCLRSVTLKVFFFFSWCVSWWKKGWKLGEGVGMSTHGARVYAYLTACVVLKNKRKKREVTNMFVSMRQQETALSRFPLWVVYKRICHIFLNPRHQPPCSTQPLATPDWSCNVFPLCSSLSLSESLALSLSICCCGIWEDFKHSETKWKRKKLREEKST